MWLPRCNIRRYELASILRRRYMRSKWIYCSMTATTHLWFSGCLPGIWFNTLSNIQSSLLLVWQLELWTWLAPLQWVSAKEVFLEVLLWHLLLSLPIAVVPIDLHQNVPAMNLTRTKLELVKFQSPESVHNTVIWRYHSKMNTDLEEVKW